MSSNGDEFEQLQVQKEQARQEGRPIEPFVRRQIALFQATHDAFIRDVQAQGYDLKNFLVCKKEVDLYYAMIQLAEEIGAPTQEYEEKVKEIQIRVFGEANYKRFSGNN